MGQFNDWGEIGQEYIYHIECGKYIYIGQSKAKNIGSRLKHHIDSILALSKDEGKLIAGANYDNSALRDAILTKGLSKSRISVYKKENNFGIPTEIMNAFKAKFISSKNEAPLSDIDAAEILHIIYYQVKKKNYHLTNTSMGGQQMSTSFINSNGETISKLLTKSMSPSVAAQIMFSSETKMVGLKKLLQNINTILFNDKEWKNFVNYASQYRRINTNIINQQTFSDLMQRIVNIFCVNFDINNLNAKSIQTKINNEVSKWAQNKIALIEKIVRQYIRRSTENKNLEYCRASELIQFDIDAAKNFQDYVSNSIYHLVLGVINEQIDKIWKQQNKSVKKTKIQWKTININSFQKSLMQKAQEWKYNIVNVSTLFDTGRAYTGLEDDWVIKFNQLTINSGDVMSEDFKKNIIQNLFYRVYKKVAVKRYYKNDETNWFFLRGEGKNVYAKRPFTNNTGNWLSVKMKQAFENARITFPLQHWTVFYRQLISIIIQSVDKWQFDSDYELYYRNGSVYKLTNSRGEQAKAYVAFNFKGKNYMNVISASQLTIY